jgi:hypothetical protein
MSSLIFGNKSIHQFFNDLITEKKQVSIDEIYRLCDMAGVRRSTAERKLRPSDSPNIEPVLNENGFIRAYRVKSTQKQLL